MIYVLETGQWTSKYASASAIVNALSYYGFQCAQWNRATPFFDLVDELKPNSVFTVGSLNSKHAQYAMDKNVRVIDVTTLINYVPDIFIYNRNARDAVFDTQCVCVASYPDVDNCQSVELAKRVSTPGFKYFNTFAPRGSYGVLSLQNQGIALASARSVLALSEPAKINAVLSNKNVFYNGTKLSINNDMIKNIVVDSNIMMAANLLPIGFNFMDKANELLSSTFGITL